MKAKKVEDVKAAAEKVRDPTLLSDLPSYRLYDVTDTMLSTHLSNI